MLMLHMFSTAPKADMVKKQSSGEHGRRAAYPQSQALLVPPLGVGWSLCTLHRKRECDPGSVTQITTTDPCGPLCICRPVLWDGSSCAGSICAQLAKPLLNLLTASSSSSSTPLCVKILLEGHVQGCSQHRGPGDSCAVMCTPSLPHRPECSYHFSS